MRSRRSTRSRTAREGQARRERHRCGEELLLAAGHDADTVPDEGLTGADDDRVLTACVAEGRMLITFDVGFGDLRAHPPALHAGIVLLRLRDQQPATTLAVMRRFLDEHDLDALAGTLVVVSDESVRIRRP